MKDKNGQLYILLFLLALIVTLTGINTRFFTDDPALYASIAKNFIYQHSFWNLYTYGQEWLDKPHFPFWIAYFSFRLFGVSAWAYRLPALLFFLLGCLYTYLFSKKYYGLETARIAVLILMTAQMTLMSATDVRAEPYLMGLIIGSIYHISRLNERFSFADLLLAALLAACAVMTKGIFVLVAIYGALFIQVVLTRQLLSLFRFKWIALILLTIIFSLPEIYSLYVQFDLHPEKLVFDRHNVSGIKWFLWDSQFGRFVNNGPITRKSGDVFFFVHTLLWAFAPWCLLLYLAIGTNVREMVKKRPLAEYYTFGGGMLLFLLFSLSSFQLPFYTNSVFPLFAVITAPYCYKQLSRFGEKYRAISLWLYIVLLIIVVFIINFTMAPGNQVFFIVDILILVLLAFLILKSSSLQHIKIVILACSVMLFVNFYLDTVFYPKLAGYKGEISAAEYVNQAEVEKYHLYVLQPQNNLFQFYTNRPIALVPLAKFKTFQPADSSLFFISQLSMDYLKSNHVTFRVVKSFVNYPQENILPAFINKDTRVRTLGQVYLIAK